MTSKSKGTYYEMKSKKYMEAGGCVVERALAKVVWIHGRPISIKHDFFGLFDLICVDKLGEVWFIQVKYKGEKTSIHGLKKLKEDMQNFPAKKNHKRLHTWIPTPRGAQLLDEGF